MSSNLFWQLAERHFQPLVDACDPGPDAAEIRNGLRKTFSALINRSYDDACPRDTARQLEAWAQYRPNLNDYLTQGAST